MGTEGGGRCNGLPKGGRPKRSALCCLLLEGLHGCVMGTPSLLRSSSPPHPLFAEPLTQTQETHSFLRWLRAIRHFPIGGLQQGSCTPGLVAKVSVNADPSPPQPFLVR